MYRHADTGGQINAFRHDKYIADATLLLKEMKGKKKEDVYEMVKKYAPFAPNARA